MTADPGATAVISPVLFTVAIAELVEVQVTAVFGMIWLLLSRTVAVF